MTIICVRDGIMAVDSMVNDSGLFSGNLTKVHRVPTEHGGGVIAGCGFVGLVSRVIDKFLETGEIEKDSDVWLMWLRGDGVVLRGQHGGWWKPDAPFHADGSGAGIALGAMAMGATATEAALVACDFDAQCRRPVRAYRFTGEEL